MATLILITFTATQQVFADNFSSAEDCTPQLTAPLTLNSQGGYSNINLTTVGIYLSTSLNDVSNLYKNSPGSGQMPTGTNPQGIKWCPGYIVQKFTDAQVPGFIPNQTDACETDLLAQGNGQPAKIGIFSVCYLASSGYTTLSAKSITTINFN